MQIDRNDVGTVTILTFDGEFNAPDLDGARTLVDSMVDSGRSKFVFNIVGLRFLSSSPVAFLIFTQKRLRGMDGELVLAEPSDFVQNTIDLLGLEAVFRIFPDNDAALAHFGER